MPWIILLGLVYFPTAFMWVSHEPWCLGLCATAAEKLQQAVNLDGADYGKGLPRDFWRSKRFQKANIKLGWGPKWISTIYHQPYIYIIMSTW